MIAAVLSMHRSDWRSGSLESPLLRPSHHLASLACGSSHRSAVEEVLPRNDLYYSARKKTEDSLLEEEGSYSSSYLFNSSRLARKILMEFEKDDDLVRIDARIVHVKAVDRTDLRYKSIC